MLPTLSNRADDGRLFATTRWSLVVAANGPGGDAREALEWLCRKYWLPLFAYVRRRGESPENAEDLVQGFFAWLLTRELLSRAEAERGRFRSYLLGCLNHFLLHHAERMRRLKRGGG